MSICKQEKETICPENLSEIHREFDRRGLTLERFDQSDEEALYRVFKEVVDAGNQFPFECNSVQEFYRRFLETKSHIYVCKSTDKEVVGGFYIKSNFPGRARHIANAGYMVKSSERGKGIGKLLVKASLEISKNLGFKAMQFNLVLSQNTVAVRLYKKLGFIVIGTIPQAIRNADGSYQDGCIMYYPFPESLSINKID